MEQRPTKNHYHKDRFRDSVSLVDHPRRKSHGGNGRSLTTDECTKSPLGTKISTKENSNHHGGAFGTELRSWEKVIKSGEPFWRENVTGQF
jgi:hypothetical protein